jgi:hypothetical protein
MSREGEIGLWGNVWPAIFPEAFPFRCSIPAKMSVMGHSRRFDRVQLTSGLTPQGDIIADRRHSQKCQTRTSPKQVAANKKPPEGGSQVETDACGLRAFTVRLSLMLSTNTAKE